MGRPCASSRGAPPGGEDTGEPPEGVVKVCLYLEMHGPTSSRGGIRQSYENQWHALRAAGVSVTSDPSESFDILHLHRIGPRSLYLAEKYSGRLPVIIHAHTTAEDFANSFMMSDSLAPYLGRLLTYFYNKADLVLVPTHYTRQVLARHGVIRPIEVISNGVDLHRFQSLRRARTLGRGRHLLKGVVAFAVGLVLLRKGVDLFVEVARRVPGMTFIWFGLIPKAVKPETLRIIEEAPANVRFAGYVENVTEAYAAGDIFFFPSTVENEGMAVLEAAAAGLPLLLRDVECFAGRFVDDYNALLAGDADEFSEHLRRLAAEPDLRDRLGAEARRYAVAHSLEQVGTQLRDIYVGLG